MDMSNYLGDHVGNFYNCASGKALAGCEDTIIHIENSEACANKTGDKIGFWGWLARSPDQTRANNSARKKFLDGIRGMVIGQGKSQETFKAISDDAEFKHNDYDGGHPLSARRIVLACETVALKSGERDAAMDARSTLIAGRLKTNFSGFLEKCSSDNGLASITQKDIDDLNTFLDKQVAEWGNRYDKAHGAKIISRAFEKFINKGDSQKALVKIGRRMAQVVKELDRHASITNALNLNDVFGKMDHKKCDKTTEISTFWKGPSAGSIFEWPTFVGLTGWPQGSDGNDVPDKIDDAILAGLKRHDGVITFPCGTRNITMTDLIRECSCVVLKKMLAFAGKCDGVTISDADRDELIRRAVNYAITIIANPDSCVDVNADLNLMACSLGNPYSFYFSKAFSKCLESVEEWIAKQWKAQSEQWKAQSDQNDGGKTLKGCLDFYEKEMVQFCGVGNVEGERESRMSRRHRRIEAVLKGINPAIADGIEAGDDVNIKSVNDAFYAPDKFIRSPKNNPSQDYDARDAKWVFTIAGQDKKANEVYEAIGGMEGVSGAQKKAVDSLMGDVNGLAHLNGLVGANSNYGIPGTFTVTKASSGDVYVTFKTRGDDDENTCEVECKRGLKSIKSSCTYQVDPTGKIELSEFNLILENPKDSEKNKE